MDSQFTASCDSVERDSRIPPAPPLLSLLKPLLDSGRVEGERGEMGEGGVGGGEGEGGGGRQSTTPAARNSSSADIVLIPTPEQTDTNKHTNNSNTRIQEHTFF
eukprot:GHVU01092119.1.p3 GENE.GHVU01092119.1~~GHVU01092119.1.p3  ORF type:complete len:104 (-),score=22.59 GHVU01092119.1:540-851(-)